MKPSPYANATRHAQRAVLWWGCAMIASAMPLAAGAEIHDYMILRLVYLNTSCGTQQLARIDAEREGWRRFHVECRDVNAYPKGLFITCTDTSDDRSCAIETPAQKFDSLELLRPNEN